MKRRTMLLGSFGFAAAAYGGTIGAGAMKPCSPFLLDNPFYASAQRIGAQLLASGFKALPLMENTLEQLRLELAERSREDFAANDTVHFDGWVLSRSEAEFCVLCSQLSTTEV